jgi:hypothetical protein
MPGRLATLRRRRFSMHAPQDAKLLWKLLTLEL